MHEHVEASNNAIVTIAIGDYFQEMARITHPLLVAYAKKCNADFVTIDTPRMSPKLALPTYERFQLFELLTKYHRIAFIDTDILIAPDAPCVFDIVPSDHLGVASEERYSQAERDKRVTQKILGEIQWIHPYFNAGMIVVSREHRELFNPDAPGLRYWATGEFRKEHRNLLNDQPFLNYRVNDLGFSLYNLGTKFNHTRAIPETQLRFRSYFIHYSGPSGHRYGPRLTQIRKDAAILTSPVKLGIARRWPWIRWILDRLNLSFVRYLAGKAGRGIHAARRRAVRE